MIVLVLISALCCPGDDIALLGHDNYEVREAAQRRLEDALRCDPTDLISYTSINTREVVARYTDRDFVMLRLIHKNLANEDPEIRMRCGMILMASKHHVYLIGHELKRQTVVLKELGLNPTFEEVDFEKAYRDHAERTLGRMLGGE